MIQLIGYDLPDTISRHDLEILDLLMSVLSDQSFNLTTFHRCEIFHLDRIWLDKLPVLLDHVALACHPWHKIIVDSFHVDI